MALWKQIALSLVVMMAAAAIWAFTYPGAPATLDKAGLGWVADLAGRDAPAAGDAQAAGSTQARQGQGGQGQGGQRQGGSAVVAAEVTSAVINDRLSAIGTGRALQSVSVTPFTSGRLTEMLVKAGDKVESGTPIAKLDSEAEQIALDRARIALSDAEAKRDRVQALRTTNTATTVQLADAGIVVDNARLELRDAELNLERRTIFAPISGIVGILPVSTGNYVTSSTVVATIDDRSSVIVDFYVPERYADMIRVGAPLTASSVGRPNEVFEGTVSAVDNRIDQASRTLQIQARLANGDDRLRAGMSFQVEMRFPGDTYPAVDPLAVQWGTDGAFVWAVRDGKAVRTPVRIIQRNTETVLVDAPLAPGELVVTEGIHTVRAGADVRVASNTTAPTIVAPVVAAPAKSGS